MTFLRKYSVAKMNSTPNIVLFTVQNPTIHLSEKYTIVDINIIKNVSVVEMDHLVKICLKLKEK